MDSIPAAVMLAEARESTGSWPIDQETGRAPTQQMDTRTEGGEKKIETRVAAVRMAAYRRLAGEVNGRNEGRAARYVATVRPAMARDRYLHLKAEVAENGVPNIEQGEQQEPAEDARPSAVPQHQKNDVVETEEGVAGVPATTSTIATVVTGSEQTDENQREQVAGGRAPPGRSALEADAQRSEEVATDDVSECTMELVLFD
ncbi:hypothetical protein PRNP1_013620 [Phytophthora ramorum]